MPGRGVGHGMIGMGGCVPALRWARGSTSAPPPPSSFARPRDSRARPCRFAGASAVCARGSAGIRGRIHDDSLAARAAWARASATCNRPWAPYASPPTTIQLPIGGIRQPTRDNSAAHRRHTPIHPRDAPGHGRDSLAHGGRAPSASAIFPYASTMIRSPRNRVASCIHDDSAAHSRRAPAHRRRFCPPILPGRRAFRQSARASSSGAPASRGPTPASGPPGRGPRATPSPWMPTPRSSRSRAR
jgi:hypothetical protein